MTTITAQQVLDLIEADTTLQNRVSNLLLRKKREEEETRNTFPYRKKGHWATASETKMIRRAYERAKEQHEMKIRETGTDKDAWIYEAYKEAWEERQRLLEIYADRV